MGEAATRSGKTCLTVIARVELGPDPANGAIVSHNGKLGGWCLYLKDGVPTCAHNWVGHEACVIRADEPVGSGAHEFMIKFECDGRFPEPGMNFTMLSNGKAIATRHFKHAGPKHSSIEIGANDDLDMDEFPSEDDFPCAWTLTGSIRGAVTMEFVAGQRQTEGRLPYEGLTRH